MWRERGLYRTEQPVAVEPRRGPRAVELLERFGVVAGSAEVGMPCDPMGTGLLDAGRDEIEVGVDRVHGSGPDLDLRALRLGAEARFRYGELLVGRTPEGRVRQVSAGRASAVCDPVTPRGDASPQPHLLEDPGHQHSGVVVVLSVVVIEHARGPGQHCFKRSQIHRGDGLLPGDARRIGPHELAEPLPP